MWDWDASLPLVMTAASPTYARKSDATVKPLNVVLGVDTSEHVIAAARFMRDLLLPEGSVVTALALLGPRRSVNPIDLERMLDRVTEIMRFNKIAVKTDLVQGRPDEQLIRFAAGHAPDLIALGAGGLSTRLGVFLSGAPQRVVETALCPVLVAREHYIHLRRVLLVVDGSWESMRAVHYLARLPLDTEVVVTVMVVGPLDHEPGPETAVTQPWRLTGGPRLGLLSEFGARDVTLQTARAVLRYATEVLRAAGVAVEVVMPRGDVAAEASRFAAGNGVDLIVAGARSHGRVGRWLAGDDTRRLIHLAGCSVLVVKVKASNP
jgi:nucleotide-binding universal stress UspA family protein